MELSSLWVAKTGNVRVVGMSCPVVPVLYKEPECQRSCCKDEKGSFCCERHCHRLTSQCSSKSTETKATSTSPPVPEYTSRPIEAQLAQEAAHKAREQLGTDDTSYGIAQERAQIARRKAELAQEAYELAKREAELARSVKF